MKYTIEYRIESTFNLEVSAESKEQALAEFKKLDITSEVIDSISDNPLAHFEISVQAITFGRKRSNG